MSYLRLPLPPSCLCRNGGPEASSGTHPGYAIIELKREKLGVDKSLFALDRIREIGYQVIRRPYENNTLSVEVIVLY